MEITKACDVDDKKVSTTIVIVSSVQFAVQLLFGPDIVSTLRRNVNLMCMSGKMRHILRILSSDTFIFKAIASVTLFVYLDRQVDLPILLQ